VKDFNPQQLANTLNALAMIGHYDEFLLKVLFFEMTKISQSDWTCEALSQLYFAVLGLTVERPGLHSIIPPQLQQYASEFRTINLDKAEKSSRFHVEVANTLTFLKIPHKNESIVGGFLIDILVEIGGEKIAVEVNGPSHYFNVTSASSLRMTGNDLFKIRVLKKQGFKVLHIPYFDWQKLRTAEQKKSYLQKMLGVHS